MSDTCDHGHTKGDPLPCPFPSCPHGVDSYSFKIAIPSFPKPCWGQLTDSVPRSASVKIVEWHRAEAMLEDGTVIYGWERAP